MNDFRSDRLINTKLNLILAILLSGAALLIGGCESFAMPGPKVVDVKAQYLDLQDKRVAVVVSTSDHTDFNYPTAHERLTREITRRIAAGVQGVTVSDPDEILKWQTDNPYWAARPASMLIKQLDVERLVLVEIGEYRTHEPGNKHELRGVIAASINVVEAEAPDPDNYGVSFSKTVMYPDPDVSLIGRVGESEQKVESMAQIRFCEEASGLFFDHKILR